MGHGLDVVNREVIKILNAELAEARAQIADMIDERHLFVTDKHALLARIAGKQAAITEISDKNSRLIAQNDALVAQIAAKDAALRFYADQRHYVYDGSDNARHELLDDGGDIARTALAAPAQEKENG